MTSVTAAVSPVPPSPSRSSPSGAPPGTASNAMDAFSVLTSRYLKLCEERRCEPIAPLLSLLETSVPTKNNAVHIHSISLRGSQPALFNKRVSYNQLDAMTEALRGACPMHTLDLSYNFIDDTGARLIADFLRETSVRVVNIRGNDIGAAGMSSIAEAIASSPGGGVQELYVSGNLFGLEGARALAGLISRSESLLVLEMKGCGIGLDGLIHISSALSAPSGASPALEVLGLEDVLQPGVQQEQAVHLAKMLACNTQLKELYIGKTGFRDLGCSTLVEYGLLRNSALTKLDLRCNSISLESGPSIARLLESNGALTSLNLSHNALGDEGARAIAHALPRNSTLSHLDVSSNSIGTPGLVSLAKALRDSDVVHVCCRGNNFSNDAPGRAFQELINEKKRRGDIVLLDIRPQEVDGVVRVAVDNENI